jgi:hypothetical protein
MSLPTLLDIVKANGSDAITGLIDETTKVHPELTQIPARTIKGINYKTLVRTALGSTSAGFRNANAGVAPIKNTYENKLVEAFYLEATWNADKAVADAYEDGAPAWLALEAGGIMEGQMQGLAGQFFYGTGTGGNASGFPGLINAYDATNMVVDAGGTTATTGSSVWLVRVGPKDVQWVWGNAGKLEMTPGTAAAAIANPVKIVDPNDSTKQFLGYQQTLTGRVGLQVGSTRSICRIKKLTADNGKGLTDSLLFDALGKFPAGLGPNLCFMTQRSLMQLQKSRTSTTSSTVKVGLSEYPKAIVGIDGQEIPILVTDAILNTEALTL